MTQWLQHMRCFRVFVSAVLVCLLISSLVAACGTANQNQQNESAIHKIQHVVIIMQENRSFDSYFGTFPGADGIPMKNGVPTVCVTDPKTGQCVKPYYNPQDLNGGGPHNAKSASADIDEGKMDGFIAQAESGRKGCLNTTNPICTNSTSVDVMGYHDARQIPNYWTYAKEFVLQDHMFEPNASWSLPAHLFMVSAWPAHCSQKGDPQSCVNDVTHPGGGSISADTGTADYAWTDLTYLLHKQNISWAYYLDQGEEPDCPDDQMICNEPPQKVKVPGIWNPLPGFDTVKADGQLGNIQDIAHFSTAAKAGTLPAVSWVAPNNQNSEHPPALISTGQAYVTSLMEAARRGLYGLSAGTASHEVINAKMQHISEYHEKLTGIIGKDQATKFFLETEASIDDRLERMRRNPDDRPL